MLEQSQIKKNWILPMLFSKKSCVPEKFLCRNLVKDCFQFTTKNEKKKKKQKQKESKETKTDKNIKKQQRQKNDASLEI